MLSRHCAPKILGLGGRDEQHPSLSSLFCFSLIVQSIFVSWEHKHNAHSPQTSHCRTKKKSEICTRNCSILFNIWCSEIISMGFLFYGNIPCKKIMAGYHQQHITAEETNKTQYWKTIIVIRINGRNTRRILTSAKDMTRCCARLHDYFLRFSSKRNQSCLWLRLISGFQSDNNFTWITSSSCLHAKVKKNRERVKKSF